MTNDAVARLTAQASTSPVTRSRRPWAATSTSTGRRPGRCRAGSPRPPNCDRPPRARRPSWPGRPLRWSPRRRSTTAGELTYALVKAMNCSRSAVGRSEVSRSTSRRLRRSMLLERSPAATAWNFRPVCACTRSSTSADSPRCWPWLSTKLNGGKSRSGANSSTGCLATQACSSAVSSVSGAAPARPATPAPARPARAVPIRAMTSRRFNAGPTRLEDPGARRIIVSATLRGRDAPCRDALRKRLGRVRE